METDTGQKVVDARDLYEGLKVKTRFNDWIVREVETYSFEEGEDFYSFLGKKENG
ncbi:MULTISPECIES: antA/AntB antirepressor family protein [Bacillus cereus group]|uniref:antA/AntB antirepressor family protein n=1 Tax=Bacillus cereus group TaxID=86661 RepID=UPI003012E573